MLISTGFLIGTFLIAPFGDKFGRKFWIIISIWLIFILNFLIFIRIKFLFYISIFFEGMFIVNFLWNTFSYII